MLPLARSVDGTLQGGFLAYIGRRAKRILPPYYAALILTLIVIPSLPGLKDHSATLWGKSSISEYTLGAIVSHFLVVHNLAGNWALKINAPFWSVATEWQIYFCFPWMLLPVWRRYGCGVLLLVAFGTGLALSYGFPGFAPACPWYLGLFASGMVAAIGNFWRPDGAVRIGGHFPWGTFTAAFVKGLRLSQSICPKLCRSEMLLLERAPHACYTALRTCHSKAKAAVYQ
jgi:peptidoglycan/LPS O-acetylase OafA/YrhL